MKIKKNINFGNYSKQINKRRSFICGIKGPHLKKKEINFLRTYKPWGIILFKRNIKDIKQTIKLTKQIKNIFEDPYYPILVDEEGGRVSRLTNIIDNSLFSSEFFGKIYDYNKNKLNYYLEVYINQISYLLKTLGININTSPVLDIRRKKYHNIVGDRSYGSNPKKISKIGDLVIDKFHKNNIQTVIKHIPGHGLAKVDSHLRLPIVKKNLKYLLKNDFLTFKKKKTLLAMTGHILFEKIDNKNCATLSKKIINIIRTRIGYKNIIVSDDISMKALTSNIELNAKKAFIAGCNIVLHCNGNLKEMKIIAVNSPVLNHFLIKKTYQIFKNLS